MKIACDALSKVDLEAASHAESLISPDDFFFFRRQSSTVYLLIHFYMALFRLVSVYLLKALTKNQMISLPN